MEFQPWVSILNLWSKLDDLGVLPIFRNFQITVHHSSMGDLRWILKWMVRYYHFAQFCGDIPWIFPCRAEVEGHGIFGRAPVGLLSQPLPRAHARLHPGHRCGQVRSAGVGEGGEKDPVPDLLQAGYSLANVFT